MTRYELRELMASLRGHVGTKEQQRAADRVEAQFAGYIDVVGALEGHSLPVLREKATMLKQMDGESWAIGEMVVRACILFDALKYGEEEGDGGL